MSSEHAASVNAHYGRPGLHAIVQEALRAAGKGDAPLTPDDLAPLDQFHTGGKPATLELARLAGLAAGMTVLDVGGGIGGPARVLAAELGCVVTVLDLTEEFCRTGEMLTARTGLTDQVQFRCASALAMPFADASFDVVWSQHSSMNIEDREQLYAEVYRVLRPGGRFAFHEIMRGSAGDLHFPVPWARDPSISFLRSPDVVRRLLEAGGFETVEWIDVTAEATAWFQARLASAGAAAPHLGLHLLLGPEAATMFRNLLRNLAEERVTVIKAVLQKR
jgi:SAM-dependent methyltransferase